MAWLKPGQAPAGLPPFAPRPPTVAAPLCSSGRAGSLSSEGALPSHYSTDTQPSTLEEEELSRELTMELLEDFALEEGRSRRGSAHPSRKPSSGLATSEGAAAAASGAADAQAAADGQQGGEDVGDEPAASPEALQPSLYDQLGGGVAVKVRQGLWVVALCRITAPMLRADEGTGCLVATGLGVETGALQLLPSPAASRTIRSRPPPPGMPLHVPAPVLAACTRTCISLPTATSIFLPACCHWPSLLLPSAACCRRLSRPVIPGCRHAACLMPLRSAISLSLLASPAGGGRPVLPAGAGRPSLLHASPDPPPASALSCSCLQAVVDQFYRRVLDDPQLGHFFQGVDMTKHTRKFLLFVTYVLGGALFSSIRT